jgi:hypothetical protein
MAGPPVGAAVVGEVAGGGVADGVALELADDGSALVVSAGAVTLAAADEELALVASAVVAAGEHADAAARTPIDANRLRRERPPDSGWSGVMG